jgi:hypothetical protein
MPDCWGPITELKILALQRFRETARVRRSGPRPAWIEGRDAARTQRLIAGVLGGQSLKTSAADCDVSQSCACTLFQRVALRWMHGESVAWRVLWHTALRRAGVPRCWVCRQPPAEDDARAAAATLDAWSDAEP